MCVCCENVRRQGPTPCRCHRANHTTTLNSIFSYKTYTRGIQTGIHWNGIHYSSKFIHSSILLSYELKCRFFWAVIPAFIGAKMQLNAAEQQQQQQPVTHRDGKKRHFFCVHLRGFRGSTTACLAICASERGSKQVK